MKTVEGCKGLSNETKKTENKTKKTNKGKKDFQQPARGQLLRVLENF